MAKTHTTLTIDSEILEQAKSLNINISGALSDYLGSLIAKYEEDIEGINIRLERINLEKALKKLSHWQMTVKQCQAKIEKWEEIQKQKEEDQLQKEKEEIENAKKCIHCNRLIEGDMKSHNFTKGLVCNICYMNARSEDIKQWMQS